MSKKLKQIQKIDKCVYYLRTLRLHGEQQVSFYDECYLILINLVPTPTQDQVIPTTNGGLILWRRVRKKIHFFVK